MKKLSALVASSLIAGSMFASTAFAGGLKMNVNGKPIEFQYGTPFIEDGSSLIPLRDLLVSLDVPNDDQHILWDGNAQSVTVIKGKTTIKLTVGQKEILRNGQLFRTLEVPAKNVDGRVFLPARAVAEALGNQVGYDASTSTVLISSKATIDPSKLSDIIAAATNNDVNIPEASANILEINKDLFFPSDRDMISLKGKTSVVTDGEISKNVAKYYGTIIEKMDITIDFIKKYTVDSGETITEAIGHTGGKVDYLSDKWRDATYYQIFFVGTNNVKKGDVAYVNGVPVGQTIVNLENIFGVKEQAPMYVLVAGNFYNVADAINHQKASTNFTVNGEKPSSAAENLLKYMEVTLIDDKVGLEYLSTEVNEIEILSVQIGEYFYKPTTPIKLKANEEIKFDLALFQSPFSGTFKPNTIDSYTVKIVTSVGETEKRVNYMSNTSKKSGKLELPQEDPYVPGQPNQSDPLTNPATPINGN